MIDVASLMCWIIGLPNTAADRLRAAVLKVGYRLREADQKRSVIGSTRFP